MEALSICAMIVGPAVVGILALVFAIRVSAPAHKTARAGRMVGSFVLLLVAYGIGCCYAGLFTMGVARRGGSSDQWVIMAVVLAGLGLLTVAWMHRTWRLPRPGQDVAEVFDVEAGPDVRVHAMVAIAVVAVIVAALTIVAFNS